MAIRPWGAQASTATRGHAGNESLYRKASLVEEPGIFLQPVQRLLERGIA